MDFQKKPIEWGICLGWELIKTRLNFGWDRNNTEVFQNTPLQDALSSDEILEKFKINLDNKESRNDWQENLYEVLLDSMKEQNFEIYKLIKLGEFGFYINLMMYFNGLGTLSTIPYCVNCRENAIRAIRALSNFFEAKIFFDHFRKLTPFQETEFSKFVEDFLETRDKILESDVAKPFYNRTKDYETSLDAALRLQSSQIPSEHLLNLKFKKAFFMFEPKTTIGGDFIFFHEETGFLYLACCDCTGHGIPGALLTINATKTLYDIINRTKAINPSIIIKQLSQDFFLYNNRIFNVSHESTLMKEYSYLSAKQIDIIKPISKEIEDKIDINSYNWMYNEGLDMSMVVIDKKNSKIYISGTNGKIFIKKNGQVDIIKTSKYNIGDYANYKEKEIDEYCIDYNKNDDIVVVMFSDGFESQFGGSLNKRIKSKNLIQLIDYLLDYSQNVFSLFKVLIRAFMLLWRDFDYVFFLYNQHLYPNQYNSDIEMILNLVVEMHKVNRLNIDDLEKFAIDKNEQVDDITVIGIKL